MRKKGKQKPIFSKLQAILENSFSVIPAAKPQPPAEPKETPAAVQPGASQKAPAPYTDVVDVPTATVEARTTSDPGVAAEVAAGPNETVALVASEPEDQVIGEEKEKVTAACPAVISPPEGMEWVVNSLGMGFVLIPAGTFLMGSPETEAGRCDDEIQHEVTISESFYLQMTPVTQGQWLAVMGSSPSSLSHPRADLPVTGVSWQDCQEFIKKLHALREGTYRLPTEAEWEYACRAGSPLALANGELITLYCELDPTLDEIGWYCGNSNHFVQPVAQKRPNAWGLYDMHGNVGEWCQNCYGPYPVEPQTDPTGASSGPDRVIRGSSCFSGAFSSAKNCRAAARFHAPPISQNRPQGVGFRLVKVV
ncbi:MAG: SUMF1/EgtB/PvdO family nonheme iron enzyme [Desulfobacteraceae bacterium]